MGAIMSEHQETSVIDEGNAWKRARQDNQECDIYPKEIHARIDKGRKLFDKLDATEDKDERTGIRSAIRRVLDDVEECMKDERSQAKTTNKEGRGAREPSAMDTGSGVDEGTKSLSGISSSWLRKSHKNPSMTVSVVKPIDCDLKGADLAFLNACKKHLEKSVNVTIKTAKVASHGNAREFSILICPIMDCLGSSVDSAMRKAKCDGDSRLALVLMHHQAPHSPLVVESHRLLTDDQYSRIGCMVDVVFWQNMGMYSCHSNTRAVQRLARFITPKMAD